MLQEQLQRRIDLAHLVPSRPYSPANQGGTGNDERIVEGCPLLVGREWGPDEQTEGGRQPEQGPHQETSRLLSVLSNLSIPIRAIKACKECIILLKYLCRSSAKMIHNFQVH